MLPKMVEVNGVPDKVVPRVFLLQVLSHVIAVDMKLNGSVDFTGEASSIQSN